MYRILTSSILLLSSLALGAEFSNPLSLVDLAATQAKALRANAVLYSIDSRSPRWDAPCQWAGWDFNYYAKVGPSEDKSGIARIKVTASAVRLGKACAFTWSTEVSHGESPAWGTLPLEEPVEGRFLSVAVVADLASRYLHAPFALESVSLYRPGIDRGPALAYLLTGKVCGGETYMVINGENGAEFQSPERPSCPLPGKP